MTLKILGALACLAMVPAVRAQGPQAGPDSHGASAATPAIYDEKADAAGAIGAALASAQRNNRRVLVQWGANWCPWCHRLHGAMSSDKAITRELQYEYDVVLVDTGRFDRNMDLAARYGADLKASGIPYLTVLDASGTPVANQETGSLESKEAGKKEHDRAAVMKFLKAHEAAPRRADDVLKDALSRARTADKGVYLYFGAPWCPWCHTLENWLDRPEVATLMDKDLVPVKVDIDRDSGGKALLERYNPSSSGGIPWHVILDADGKVIATSNGPKGNIGYPAEPFEIEHFVTMLKGAQKRMSGPDIEALAASLKASRPGAH